MVNVERIISNTIESKMFMATEIDKENLKNDIDLVFFTNNIIIETEKFNSVTKERLEKTLEDIKKEVHKYLEELKSNKKSFDNDWSIAEVKNSLTVLKSIVLN